MRLDLLLLSRCHGMRINMLKWGVHVVPLKTPKSSTCLLEKRRKKNWKEILNPSPKKVTSSLGVGRADMKTRVRVAAPLRIFSLTLFREGERECFKCQVSRADLSILPYPLSWLRMLWMLNMWLLIFNKSAFMEKIYLRHFWICRPWFH